MKSKGNYLKDLFEPSLKSCDGTGRKLYVNMQDKAMPIDCL